MRRVRYYSHGGPEVLVTEEASIPEPGTGQVLIRTEAIGVNYVDVQLRRETAPDSPYFRSLPATLTGDVVGTIEKVGPDADPALAGTRVAVLLEDAYADYVVADASWLVGVPASLGADTASMLPTAGAVALGTLRTGRLSHAIAVGRYPSLRQRANQRRWRFVGGDPRFGVAQVLLGGLAGIGAARTGLWVLAVAFAFYVVSIFWGEQLWKCSLTA